MLEPDEVAAMMRLHRLGWGTRRLAQQFGCSRTTVKRYVAAGGWRPFPAARRASKLDGLEEWLRERFHRHRGNADVVRQDLAREHGIAVSLRTVERAVQPYRRELVAEARATLRFETPPGWQLQIDFGETRVPIGGERVRVYLFVATLGYSRRPYVQAFRHERQSAWLDGIEAAFRHFGGVPEEVLLDNARALVTLHDAGTREVSFNARLKAFADYWRFRPRACAPYRARTKGKDERGVGYVKHNAIAGHAFESWEALEAHLAWWTREIADVRVHGTTGEAPLLRFQRDEAAALRPLAGRPPFRQIRELVRKVQADCAVEVDTNAYSVPWRLIGESVQVSVSAGRVRVHHAGRLVAEHVEAEGRHRRIVERGHFAGVVGLVRSAPAAAPDDPPASPPELLRALSEYEAAAGGGW
ncbi:MAG: IS21 family transposase [Actinomycetota bacterium]|nr:IS21 family transposase [Actinomycetota bacterium]